MSRRLQISVLALAASASVAVAAVRIAAAAGSHAEPYREEPRGEYGATPAQERTALSMLVAPPGFQSRSCGESHPVSPSVCFGRPAVVPLDTASLRRLTRAMGAKPTPLAVFGAPGCGRTRRFRRADLRFVSCEATASIGGQWVSILAHSLQIGPHNDTPFARKRVAGWLQAVGRGTEIQVGVIGHRLSATSARSRE